MGVCLHILGKVLLNVLAFTGISSWIERGTALPLMVASFFLGASIAALFNFPMKINPANVSKAFPETSRKFFASVSVIHDQCIRLMHAVGSFLVTVSLVVLSLILSVGYELILILLQPVLSCADVHLKKISEFTTKYHISISPEVVIELICIFSLIYYSIFPVADILFTYVMLWPLIHYLSTYGRKMVTQAACHAFHRVVCIITFDSYIACVTPANQCDKDENGTSGDTICEGEIRS